MQLGDISRFGDGKDLRASLNTLAERLQSVGRDLVGRLGLDDGCHVFPAIAEATASQLILLARLFEEPIEITAGVCRTVFEIEVTLLFCLSAPERLRDYATQSATDEVSIYKSLKDLANESTNPIDIKMIDDRIEHIRRTLQSHGRLLKPSRTSISQMAKEVGLQTDYEALYGIYSKYIHASAWFIVRKREHTDLPVFRVMMQLHAQLYASRILKQLEDIRG